MKFVKIEVVSFKIDLKRPNSLKTKIIIYRKIMNNNS